MAGFLGGLVWGTNTQLYDLDFYLWCLDTCATLGAREFEALDVHHLIVRKSGIWGTISRALSKVTCARSSCTS